MFTVDGNMNHPEAGIQQVVAGCRKSSLMATFLCTQQTQTYDKLHVCSAIGGFSLNGPARGRKLDLVILVGLLQHEMKFSMSLRKLLTKKKKPIML